MIRLALVFAQLSLAGVASAQSVTTTQAMTCAVARGIVEAEGAVVLRTGPLTYDRYVSHAGHCQRDETVNPAFVRTADVPQCLVGGVCRPVDIESGR